MPRNLNKRKRFRGSRKQLFRGNRRNGRKMQLSNLGTVLQPDRIKVTLKVTAFANYAFSDNNLSRLWYGNNCFRPGNGDFNNQPVGLQNYLALYNQYVVTGSTISLELINGSQDQAITGIWIALYPTKASTPISTDVVGAAAQKYVVNRYVGSPIAANKITVKHRMTTTKIFGFNCLTDEDFSGDSTGVDPVKQWFWCVVMSGIDNDPIFPVVQVLIKINYHIQFFNAKNLSMTTV